MATILNIETATKNCSVSIAKSGKIIAVKELNDNKLSHAEKLHTFIDEAIRKSAINIDELDAVAVSKGPGSYTGLRIGVSAAKGLCFALNKPLISIETLHSLATSLVIKEGYIAPMIDARRMEVYTTIYSKNYEKLQKTKAEIINENSFIEYLQKNKVCFIGDGAEKCKEIIKHKNAFFIDDKLPSAKEMGVLSFKKYLKKSFEDVAYFEPFYLKDFIATPEKN